MPARARITKGQLDLVSLPWLVTGVGELDSCGVGSDDTGGVVDEAGEL
jgi:hypothetical protein